MKKTERKGRKVREEKGGGGGGGEGEGGNTAVISYSLHADVHNILHRAVPKNSSSVTHKHQTYLHGHACRQ